ncbi:MAG TPA: phytoene desaturase family protein [Saprospiraceae bacterium]|nr:phytoene desaturase family protein [Saprospiraceae bacterium]
MRSGKKISVIGSGISGLAAATVLADKGHQVQVFEKNDSHGGRGRMWSVDGFHFDMGPSWYWMPDVFERYFARFGKKPEDYYKLVRLDPSYQIVFGQGVVSVPASFEESCRMFDQLEPGSSRFLKRFMASAKFKYEVGMKEFAGKPALSLLEFLDLRLLKPVLSLDLFESHERQVFRGVKHPWLRQLLSFPVLFLGAKPSDTPALYSLMNYADLVLGTWYPMGGMVRLFDAMFDLAKEKGVEFHFNTPVSKILIRDKKAVGVEAAGRDWTSDAVISSADYHFTEQVLLDPPYRQYSESYWEKRTMAPSALLFYLGFDARLSNLQHHNLFFNADFDRHTHAIYDQPAWPQNPLFYACMPSVTDPSVAPAGKENLFILVPLAAGLKDDPNERERIFQYVMDHLEARTQMELRSRILVRKEMGLDDFQTTYNSFRGNAYGLANTLRQTAILKPRLKNKRVEQLYYAGQLSHPGPGLPPALMSGQISAELILKNFAL